MTEYVSSSTRLYAVVGWPIGHSLSPVMHNSLFRRRGLDAVYVALGVREPDLQCFLRFARDNLAGFNVTIPLKESVVRFMDWVEDSVRIVGALNTVKNQGGELRGYNTDLRAMEELLCARARGARALVLGAGGAGRAVVYALASCGASVVLANRTLERARELARWFGKMGMEISVVPMGELRGVVYGVDIIVNATSVGLHDDSSPIEDVGSSRLVVDLVYRRFGETPLVRLARSRGCEVVDGLVVLVHQGVHSFRIWTGVEVSRDEVDWLLGMLRRGLIQPPGPVPDAP